MKTLIKIVLCLGVLLTPVTLSATREGPLARTNPLGVLLAEVTLTESVANRTFVIPAGKARGFGALVLWVKYTYATAGDFSVTCTTGPSAADRDYQPTTCTDTLGTCKLNLGGKAVLEAVTQSEKFWIRMGILGTRDMSCVVAHTAAAAGDLAEIKGEFAVQ